MTARPLECTKDGIRPTCFFCGNTWTGCTCVVPERDKILNYTTSEKDGFEFGGFHIVDPSLSENTLYFVDPVIYYGKPYLDWVAEKIANTPWKGECGICGLSRNACREAGLPKP
jgi:hypothetical protein